MVMIAGDLINSLEDFQRCYLGHVYAWCQPPTPLESRIGLDRLELAETTRLTGMRMALFNRLAKAYGLAHVDNVSLCLLDAALHFLPLSPGQGEIYYQDPSAAVMLALIRAGFSAVQTPGALCSGVFAVRLPGPLNLGCRLAPYTFEYHHPPAETAL
jgi:hypothetical protein